MADDLDDEWWLDNKDENEKGKSDEDSDSAPGADADESGNENSGEAPEDEDDNVNKRKLESGESEGDESEEPVKKKKKRKRKKISEILANEKPSPLFPQDMISSMTKHYEGKLSPVEQDEVTIEDEHFTTCNDGTHTVTSYLRFILPKWKKLVTNMEQQPGTPLLIVICGSGLRAANLTRELRNFSDDVQICKLFAKHIKLAEQIKYLKSRKTHIGIGTPNRIRALLDDGVLKLEQVKYFVVDWSFRDTKFRRIGDIAEIRKDLYDLFSSHLIPRVKSKRGKFALM